MIDAPVDFEQAVPVRPAAVASVRTVRPGRRFDLLGFRWRRGDEPGLRLRVRSRGRWSRWVEVPHAESPLRRPGQEASAPVWAGNADAYQLRVAGRVRALRAHFVRVPRPRGSPPARAAQAGRPAIAPRAAWGASQCPPRAAPRYGRVEVAFVHHTVNANDYTPQESPAIVLAICRLHRNSNGWSDIGYNLLVDRYGQVFEGRSGGVERAVVGAQAGGYNSVSTGVANIGEFTRQGQTPAGLGALGRVLAWKLGLHGVPAQGTVSVGGRTFNRISGHRDANATACPGDALYAQLPQLRRLVAADGGTGPRGLTLEVERRVALPAAPRFAGALAGAEGAPLPGRAVELQARLVSREWRTIASAVTALDGRWSLSLPTTRNGTFRARFAGDGSAAPQTTPPRRVLVSPRLVASSTRARVRRGRPVTLTGAITPPKRAGLEVLAWRRSRGANRFAGRFAVTGRGSSFAARVRVRAAALYRFQVAFRGDAANAPARSNVVWVRSG